jgi:peroxiredoxin
MIAVLAGGLHESFAQSPAPSTPAPGSAAALPLAGHSLHGEAFNEGPRQGAYLMGGTGSVRFPITARNPRVRELFDQGVGQLHGFWYFEAERSFRQAAAIEPGCAMAYWGMAMANANNDARAKGFIAKAMVRRESASEREVLYIEALNAFLTSDKDRKRRGEAYVKALEGILHRYPDDIEAKAFVVLALWHNAGHGSPITSHVAADALLDQVFAVEPMHPAHHYRIHIWDDERPQKALASAAVSGQSAPSIAHMWHMSGHIHSKLKRYADAAWQQEASARVDHAHMVRDRVLPDQIHNFAHNNEWLIRNLIKLGRMRDALDLAKNMIELPRHPKLNTYQKRGSAWLGRERLFEVLEGFELWDETAMLCDTPYLEPTDLEEEQLKRLRRLGAALFRKGDVEGGNRQIADLEERLAKEKAAIEVAAAPAPSADAGGNGAPSGTPEREPGSGSADGVLPATSSSPAPAASRQPPAASSSEAPAASRQPPAASSSEAPAASRQPPAASSSEAPAASRQPPAASSDEARKAAEARAQRLEKALTELRGHRAVAMGDPKAGLALLKEAGGVDPVHLARVEWQAGDAGAAEDALRKLCRERANEVLPLAHLAELYWLDGRKREAAIAFSELRALSASLDLDAPVMARLGPLAAALGLPADWRVSGEPAADAGVRPDLASLGPFRWHPSPAPGWTLQDAKGWTLSLGDFHGRPLVLIFYLGFGCLHCVEQLQAFAPLSEEFAKEGLALLAISSDGESGLRSSAEQYGKGGFPFPILSDPDLAVFKAYRAYDDFERQPLHATILLDADGLVRWSDVSFEPFKDPSFVFEEWRRLERSGLASVTDVRRRRL